MLKTEEYMMVKIILFIFCLAITSSSLFSGEVLHQKQEEKCKSARKEFSALSYKFYILTTRIHEIEKNKKLDQNVKNENIRYLFSKIDHTYVKIENARNKIYELCQE